MNDYHFPTLYIWDNDKVREWQISVSGTTNNARHIATYGHKDGKVTKKVTEVFGKNIGKSNATTSLQQAMNDAQSIHNKKLKEGYKTYLEFDTNPPAYEVYGTTGTPKAMLLYKVLLPGMKKGVSHFPIKFPAYVQEKLDGLFSSATLAHGLISRGGELGITRNGDTLKQIFPEITTGVQSAIRTYETEYRRRITLNGELYTENCALEDITSACKIKQNLSAAIRYCIFDVFLPDKPNATQEERFAAMSLLAVHEDVRDYIAVVRAKIVNNWEELFAFEDEILERGGEGVVVRNTGNVYVPGSRSNSVLKLVRMDTTIVTIVDIVPMRNEPTQGVFVCSHNGTQFNVTPSEFTHDHRSEMLFNKANYIGSSLVISHRGYYKDSGIPRIAKAGKDAIL